MGLGLRPREQKRHPGVPAPVSGFPPFAVTPLTLNSWVWDSELSGGLSSLYSHPELNLKSLQRIRDTLLWKGLWMCAWDGSKRKRPRAVVLTLSWGSLSGENYILRLFTFSLFRCWETKAFRLTQGSEWTTCRWISCRLPTTHLPAHDTERLLGRSTESQVSACLGECLLVWFPRPHIWTLLCLPQPHLYYFTTGGPSHAPLAGGF